MSQVTVGENEGIESAASFQAFRGQAGIFSDRRIRHHETPVEKYKRKLKQRSAPPSLSPTHGHCQINRKRVDSGPLF